MTTTTSTTEPLSHAPGTTTALAPPTGDDLRPVLVRRQTLGRAIASEWIKLRTLRSTWVTLAVVAALLVGLAALVAQLSDPGRIEDPLSTVLLGANFAVLLAGVMGGLVGAREFGSRMITVTAAAVPRRWQIVVAKAVSLSAVVVPAALVGVFGAFWVGMALLSARGGTTVSLTGDGVLGTLLGMVAYIDAIALLGLGLGIVLRSVAGSIGVIVAVVLVLPPLAGSLLPSSWDTALELLPSAAGSAFTAVQGAGDSTLSATAGALVLVAWVLGLLASAAVLVGRRDV